MSEEEWMVTMGVPYSEPIAGFLHRFQIEERQIPNPVMRRYRATCECEWEGEWRRDRIVAVEEGQDHQDDQQ